MAGLGRIATVARWALHGQKRTLPLTVICIPSVDIRIRLQLANCTRNLALFDLSIDSKLRACDLVKLRVRDVCHGDRVATDAIIMQHKTKRHDYAGKPALLIAAINRWRSTSRRNG